MKPPNIPNVVTIDHELPDHNWHDRLKHGLGKDRWVALKLRRSKKYDNGPNKHLDRWMTIGTMRESQRFPRVYAGDDTEHLELRVEVRSKASQAQIRQALKDTNTYVGCEHPDWQDCLCQDFICDNVHVVSGTVWSVIIDVQCPKAKRS
jgi:hypothetical protein